MSFAVRRLTADDVPAFREIRLEGLAAEPMSFGSTLEEDALVSDDDWRQRISTNATFGVFDDDGLAGIAAYAIEGGAKTRHRAHLVSVYVRPRARGNGAASQLIAAVIEAARQNVAFLYLQVGQANARAVRFYERIGFTIYGRDPGGLKVGGTVYEDYLMMLRLDEGGTESDSK